MQRVGLVLRRVGRASERVRLRRVVVQPGGMRVRWCRHVVELSARGVGRVELHVRGRRKAVRARDEPVRRFARHVAGHGRSV